MPIRLNLNIHEVKTTAKTFAGFILISFCSLFTTLAFASDIFSRFESQQFSFSKSTYLLELQQGSFLSQIARSNQFGGFELSSGGFMSFNKWYRSKWTDSSISWMTQLNEDFGIIYGFSTGERAEKFTIDPSIKLGFVLQSKLQENITFSVRATTIIGGMLKEKTCTADYGEIGGVQEVNCRLAATPLEPSETLKFLLNEKPFNRNQLLMRVTWQF